MKSESSTSQRIRKLLDETGLTQSAVASHLGVTPSFVSQLLHRGQSAGPKTLRALRVLETRYQYGSSPSDLDPTPNIGLPRYVPRLSWDEASTLLSVEHLPATADRSTLTDCTDDKAFSVVLGGEEISSTISKGDVATLMPGVKLRAGCLVVAHLVIGGLVFRFWNPTDARGEAFRLASSSRLHKPIDLTWDDVHWVYAVHQVARSVW